MLADSNILILSDRAVSADRIPIPALLATAAVHHHLIRQGLRMQTGLVVETGEAREVHHFCVLAGYGAEAVNPYLAFETLEQLRVAERPAAEGLRGAEELHQGGRQGHAEGDVQDGHLDLPVLLRRADLRRGRPVSRASSRSTSPAPPPPSRASGWQEIAEETVRRHARRLRRQSDLPQHARSSGGDYAFRLRGEDHAWTPDNVARLQHAVRGNSAGRVQGLRRARSTSRASGC